MRDLEKKRLIESFEAMLYLREVDRRAGIWVRQGRAHFNVSSAGHEAVLALQEHLKESDYIFPYYRDKALVYRRGYSVEDIVRNILATKTEFSEGRSMCGHYTCSRKNIFSHASPTGSQILPACGIAWSFKLRSQHSQIVLCSIGDAATRQGEFFEGVAFALEKRLPILIVVQDNKYGISSQIPSPRDLGLLSVENLDGSDFLALKRASKELIQEVRNGEGPKILWLDLDRLDSHTTSDDQRIYRSKTELARLRDPIEILFQQLSQERIIDQESFLQRKSVIEKEVEEIFYRVQEEGKPDKSGIMKHLFASTSTEKREFDLPCDQLTERINMVEGINYTLDQGLKKYSEMICFGEDIEDPLGGVFRLTKNLKRNYPNQVYNSPLAEATIVGTGVGLSAVAMKPVFEIQFVDFIAPALNQIFTQLATLRWRTAGDWQAPMVLYATYGGYLPGLALWHSQTLDAIFAHIPGLRLAIPSNPNDAIGLFWAAIQSSDPILILIPKFMMFKRKQIDKDLIANFRLDQGRIVKLGGDLTLVTWGNTVELAEQAQEDLKDRVSIEIIDLRTIVPCDYELIKRSVRKTKRLLVVHEDNRNASLGATIISNLIKEKEIQECLESNPRLIAKDDLYIGFNTELEMAILPSTRDIIKAALELVSQ